MPRITLLLLPGLLFLLPALGQQTGGLPDEELLSGLKFRLVGPFRGGRSTAVTGVVSEPFTFYMGTSGGGVWKTVDAGVSWRNISDGFFKTGSVGAVAVAPSDPNVVYVGTGSGCPRGNVSPGDGIYRSTDAGRSWKHVGLPDSGLIARMAVHPEDPDRAYAAVLGNPFGSNPQRGLFRTVDGGQSWDKVLFVSDRTGAVDVVIDPGNPRVIWAAMWQVERKPWTLIDGGPEGGVYRSSDGGDHWSKVEGGLPTSGNLGRIGVAVAPTNSDRIWVLLEAEVEEEGGLYRSDDGGESFKRINPNRALRTRAWYYNHVFADPADQNTVYVLNGGFHGSIDGGETFRRIRTPHGDNHALWVNPQHPDIWITGNDGGGAVTVSDGASWSTQFNQPTAEFYRLTVDNQFPYRLYGSQQDNSTISVPSRSFRASSGKQHWIEVGGGESGHVAVDPTNPEIVYSGNYIGQITRYDRGRGHRRDVVAYPEMHDGKPASEIKYRFQWNAPIRISPHDPSILYHASQFVHRSRDGGQSWEVISPDLSTDNPRYQEIPGGPIQHDHTGVELYTTIFSFEESPHTPGVLWAGTDDGRVHVLRQGADQWEEVTPPAMPAGGTVNTIEISPHSNDRIFLSVYRYRENDFRPYVFRTNDGGRNWSLLTDGSNGIPADHWVRVVREDPLRRGLLYAGTEFGLYVSFNDGANWQTLQLNLPITPVTDLRRVGDDLVVATQGRSFWILDDVSPLSALTAEVTASAAHLFAPREAIRTGLGGMRASDAPPPPPPAAGFYYWLSADTEEVRIEVVDASDTVVAKFGSNQEDDDASDDEEDDDDASNDVGTTRGLHRVGWDLRYQGAEIVKGAVFSLSNPATGPHAAPGRYRVRLMVGEQTFEQTVTVKADPRWTATAEDLQAQHELAIAVRDKLTETHSAIKRMRALATQIKVYKKRASGDNEIAERADRLLDQLDTMEDRLIQRKSKAGQDPINYPPRLDDQLSYLMEVVDGQDARPTEGSLQRFQDLNQKVSAYLEAFARFEAGPIADFNRIVRDNGLAGIRVPE